MIAEAELLTIVFRGIKGLDWMDHKLPAYLAYSYLFELSDIWN